MRRFCCCMYFSSCQNYPDKLRHLSVCPYMSSDGIPALCSGYGTACQGWETLTSCDAYVCPYMSSNGIRALCSGYGMACQGWRATMRCGLMNGRNPHRPWPCSTSPPGSKVCTDSQMPSSTSPPDSKVCTDSQMPFLLTPPGSKVCTESQMPFSTKLVCNFQSVSFLVRCHAACPDIRPPVVVWQANIGAWIVRTMAGCVCCMHNPLLRLPYICVLER